MDYACRYVRATKTSQLTNADYDPGTGQITAAFSGSTDLPITAYYYTGEDSGITNVAATVPSFSGTTNVLLAGPPQFVSPAVSGAGITFTLQGPAGNSYIIEGTTNFRDWTPLRTVSLTNGAARISQPLTGVVQLLRARLTP